MIYPTKVDIGRSVIYVPMNASGDITHPDCEGGFITSFNNSFVFVRYGMSQTGAATRRSDLEWG